MYYHNSKGGNSKWGLTELLPIIANNDFQMVV